MRLVVTGGCGFIGTNFIRLVLAERPAARIVNVDKLTYAGNPANLADVETRFGTERYRFVQADVADAEAMHALFGEESFDAVVHFAAESHVDRSINNATPFVQTNVLGTLTLLEAARAAGTPRFVQVSTDEVYGTLGPEGAFSESTPLAPLLCDEANAREYGPANAGNMPDITAADNHGASIRNVVFLDGHVVTFKDANAANAIFDNLKNSACICSVD